MYRFLIILLLFLGVGVHHLLGQRTTVYTETNVLLKDGQEKIDLGLFQEAQRVFTVFLDQPRPIQDHVSQINRERAGLFVSQSSIRAGDPLAERKILEFARSTSPDPMGNQALLEAAHYYFNIREYAQAVHFYDLVNTAGLSESSRTETVFKKGYSYFIQKDFSKARNTFGQIKDGNHDYFYPANYYYGMTLFFDGKYEDALTSFRRVENSDKYAPYIPYIISQILFAQSKYDELIAYNAKKVNVRVENQTEIEQLIGRAYFEKGDYKSALPHLTYYAERSGTMLAADFYQLGYAQYQSGAYTEAIKNLEPLTRQEDAMGQQALFVLGDAYIQTGQKIPARNAFMQASRMTYSPQVAESALFQFAKLSYELRADREAVQALNGIGEKSPFYAEAQKLLGEVLVKTQDVDFALDYLSKANLKTPQLKEAYQKVHYLKASKLVQEGLVKESIPYLKKSMSTSVDNRTQTLAAYLLADVYHQLKSYSESTSEINKYFTLAKSLKDLPSEASLPMANYIQGYNLLKTNKHNLAATYFQDCVAGLKRDAHKTFNPTIKNTILGDAIIRTGDCYFKVNKYVDALGYYNEAINNRYTGFHYARFQKALILGLQNKPYDKIVELEQLVSDFPNSDYADDALYEMGSTAMDLGQMLEAIKPFKRLIQDYATRSDLVNAARLKLGLISYNQGDLQDAIRYYRQVLESNPDPDERLAAIGALEEIYVRDLSSPEEYFAILEKSGYNLSDASRDSLNFKAADNQYLEGNYEKAIQAYSQYLQKFPNGLHTLQAFYRRGECYSVEKQYTKALNDYTEVIKKGPSRFYEDALGKAALIAYNHELNYKEAFRFYQLLEKSASNESARFDAQLGALRSAYRSNQPDEVIVYADKVIRNTQAGDTQIGQARFYQGKVNYDQKKYDLALNDFQIVLQKLDNELAGEAHYLIADVYFKKRQLEESKSWCLQSNQKIPGQDYWVAKCILLLSDIFVEENDLFNARAALEGLLENYQGDTDLRKTAQEKLEYIVVLEGKSNRISKPLNNNLLEMQED
jgi:tetratricopeptide (TPR) repeat protein